MLELSTLCCSRTHNNTLHILQRRALGPVPPKAGPVHVYNNFKFQISKHNIFKITSEVAVYNNTAFINGSNLGQV